MRVIAFPSDGIAYIDSFYAALRSQGADVVKGVWSGRWLAGNLKPDDVVHIHWPSFLYGSRPGVLTTIYWFSRFVVILTFVRAKVRHVLWTAHNLYPHEPSRVPGLDEIARRLCIKLADRIFVHSPEAERLLTSQFPGALHKTTVIPHGNWIGRYGEPLPHDEAKKRLSLNRDQFVFLLFGQCKPYKNVVGLIEAFRRIARDDSALIVAGGFSDQSYLQDVLAAADGSRGIRIDARFIPDDEVRVYLSAADVMCIPYREILTSGTAVLAMSYAVPVISIDRGFLHDVVGEESGILIPKDDPDALAEALCVAREREWDRAKILAAAQKYRFEDAARVFVETVAALSGDSVVTKGPPY